MARLFVAAWPDDALAERLDALPRPDEDGVRWSPPSNWHITLRFIGEAPAEAVVDRLASTVLPPATVTLGPAVQRLGPQVVVIPVAGADELADAVRAATDGLGQPDRYDFRGHLTLARTGRNAPCSLVGTAFSSTGVIERVSLVQSTLDADGSIYETVATFDLT